MGLTQFIERGIVGDDDYYYYYERGQAWMMSRCVCCGPPRGEAGVPLWILDECSVLFSWTQRPAANLLNN